MDYKVYNDSLIGNQVERDSCRSLIGKQVAHLEHISSGYSKKLALDLHFSRTTKERYLLTAIMRLSHKTLIVKQKGDNPEGIIHALFDRLKLSLNKELHRSRNEHVRYARHSRISSFSESLPELIELKSEGSDELLKDLLKLLLNDLAKYIRRRLKTAEMTSAVKKGMFKVQELLDEIYLVIFDRLEEIPGDETETLIWLHTIVDDYLNEKFRELEFEKENFDRIENILESEYDSMEEEYTVDADFQVVPLEELDEYEDQHPVYSVNQLQYEADENSLLDDLILKLTDKELHAVIEKELMKLPVLKRTVMDLYLNEQLTVEDISRIKGITISDAESIITEVNDHLKRKLKSVL